MKSDTMPKFANSAEVRDAYCPLLLYCNVYAVPTAISRCFYNRIIAAVIQCASVNLYATCFLTLFSLILLYLLHITHTVCGDGEEPKD